MSDEQIRNALNIGVGHAREEDLRVWLAEAQRIAAMAEAAASKLDPKLRRKSRLADKFDSLAVHARGIALTLNCYFEAEQSSGAVCETTQEHLIASCPLETENAQCR